MYVRANPLLQRGTYLSCLRGCARTGEWQHGMSGGRCTRQRRYIQSASSHHHIDERLNFLDGTSDTSAATLVGLEKYSEQAHLQGAGAFRLASAVDTSRSQSVDTHGCS